MSQVVVVGAGVGGLVAAASLAAQGCAVTVCERAKTPGGKMRQVQAGPAAIDAGPTVLTMRWVFEALFDSWGERLEDRVRLTPLSILARHAWSAQERLDLFADPLETEAAIAAFAGLGEVLAYRAFRREAARIFRVLRGPFLERAKPNLPQLLGRIGPLRLGDLLAIRPYESLAGALAGRFRDPRLRQLFARYATYAGSSPFRCPATLMLIAHVELEGVWSVQGGMFALAQALESAARAQGVRFRYGAEVEAIEVQHGRASGVRLADGEQLAAEAVVFNGDPGALAEGLLGDPTRRAAPAPHKARSLSACAIALQARVEGFPLSRHNVFFSRDYRAEFDDIFSRGRAPLEPTVYICAQDRGEHPHPAGAPERLLLLVNAPANGDRAVWSTMEIEACETSARTVLHRCGLTLPAAIEARRVTTPRDFARLFPGSGGAIYGRASHGWLASFLRPGAGTALPGLFLAGGGTHPGAGAPMAALSGRLAAEAVLHALRRRPTSRSAPPRAGMSGGISTRSAQTAPTD